MDFKFCDPCNKSFNGARPYNDHMASEKHKKKVFQVEASSAAAIPGSSPGFSSSLSDPFIEIRGKDFWCTICKLYLNSTEQVNSHVRGSKHLKLKPFQLSQKDVSEIPKINLSNIKLTNTSENSLLDYSDFKFSFHGIHIENVLDGVKVFGIDDPIVFSD